MWRLDNPVSCTTSLAKVQKQKEEGLDYYSCTSRRVSGVDVSIISVILTKSHTFFYMQSKFSANQNVPRGEDQRAISRDVWFELGTFKGVAKTI